MNLFQRMNKGFKKRPSVDMSLADDLMDQTQDRLKEIQPISILLAGKTGSGKSSLINGLFRERLAETGQGLPVTQNLTKITKEGVPLILYDTKGLELSGQAQQEVLETVSSLLQGESADSIDLVYYCLSGPQARIESFEVDLIQALSQYAPVILVITQAVSQEATEFQETLSQMDLPVAVIVPVLALDLKLPGNQTIEAFGLQHLVDVSLDQVSPEAHQSFINAQRIDLTRKVDGARTWARRYISTAFGVGFTPLPVSDSLLLVPMQITMLSHITAIFGLSLDKSQLVSIIAGIGGTGSATLLGKQITASLSKVIPGVGKIAGGVISGSTAAVLTLALAYSYIEVLRQIATAELTGRDLPVDQLRRTMSRELKANLEQLSQQLPQEVADQLTSIIPAWLRRFISS